MKLGIVGLPNVGKSTLFNAITNAGAQSANYPFCTIEPNIGVVSVPDKRLEKLSKLYDTDKTTHASVEFLDIAGLVKGASKGEGLGNKFLANIREVDAILHVVRCFENNDIVHVDGSIDPERDIQTINIELTLSDLDVIQRKIEKTQKMIKADKSYKSELDFFERLKDQINNGVSVRSISYTEEEKEYLKGVSLLTLKPVVYVANMDESDFVSDLSNNKFFTCVEKIADTESAMIFPICAEIESQISGMGNDEKQLFLSDMGLSESGLDRLIKKCYTVLGLMSYITAGKPEVRAWTIQRGTKAPQAAGKIHSDFERGFIRAEVITYDDLIKCGSLSSAKEKGLVRSEGKEYVMKDGDIVLFRFNV